MSLRWLPSSSSTVFPGVTDAVERLWRNPENTALDDSEGSEQCSASKKDQSNAHDVDNNLTPDDLSGLNQQDLIGAGVFTLVYRLNDRTVRKVVAPGPDNLQLARKSIRREGEIYDHLGDHPRVIKCTQRGDHFIDLEYAPNGNISSFLRSHSEVSDESRIRLAREAIEAVVFIHSKGIIHSDLAPRQFLLDVNNHVKISDFGFSSFGDGDILGFENSANQLPRDVDGAMPSTIQSDLFALGSTLYEIMTGEKPYQGRSDDDITQHYKDNSFPDVTNILNGTVIMGCWQCHFESAAEVLAGFLPVA